MTTFQHAHTMSPAERLERLQQVPIEFRNSDARIEFKFDAAANAEVIAFHNGKGQHLVYRIENAAKSPEPGEVSRAQLIGDLYNEMKTRAADGAPATWQQFLHDEDPWKAAFERLNKLGAVQTAASLNSADPSLQHDAIKRLTSLNYGDPGLYGFKKATSHEIPAPGSEKAKDAAAKGEKRAEYADYIEEIRANRERIQIVSQDGNTVVDLALGSKSKLRVTSLRTDGSRAAISVRLEPEMDSDKIVEKVQAILKILNSTKEFSPSGVSKGVSPEPIARVALECLSSGRLLGLENVELTDAAWSRIRTAWGCQIKNVKVHNSTLEIVGSFYAENLETTGNTRLLLQSSNSVFKDCSLGEGTLLSGDLSNSTFVGERILVRHGGMGQRIECNALDCILRGVKFQDSMDPTTERKATWREFRGMVFREENIDTGGDLFALSRDLNKRQFAKILEGMDPLNPEVFCNLLKSLDSNLSTHLHAPIDNDPKDEKKGQTHIITVADAQNKKSVVISFNDNPELRKDDPNGRVEVSFFDHEDPAASTQPRRSFKTSNLFSAFPSVLEFVASAGEKDAPARGIRGIPKDEPVPEYDLDSHDIIKAHRTINAARASANMSAEAKVVVDKFFETKLSFEEITKIIETANEAGLDAGQRQKARRMAAAAAEAREFLDNLVQTEHGRDALAVQTALNNISAEAQKKADAKRAAEAKRAEESTSNAE